MSNIIQCTTTSVFPPDQLDIPRLLAAIAKVNEYPGTPNHDPDSEQVTDWTPFIIWWYLGDDNVWLEDGCLCIEFGKHRSEHTWRDLGATLIVLNQFALQKNVRCPIHIIDKDNNFADCGEVHFDLATGQPM